MPNYYVPNADESSSVFTGYGSGSIFHDRMDDYPSSDDSNGAQYDTTTVGTPSLVMQLRPTIAPSVNTAQPVTMIVRAGGFIKDIPGTISAQFTASLYEGSPAGGGTIRASFNFSRTQSGTYTDSTYALSSGEKSSITNWGNLYIAIQSPVVSGTGDMELRISEFAVEYDPSAVAGRTRKRSHLMLMGLG